jgi:2-polyprenyl-3-methyl-5-hydroxy-6-metoxy-1,4-benzoquinol methylase
VTRFAFGDNWQAFRRDALDDGRIERATESLRDLVGDLTGKTFVDVGCGSGLFSLAAHAIGAARVVSFDVDEACVACTSELRGLRRRRDWEARHGSVLDGAFVESLGTFDVVYAWGSLHHTGDMWRALDLTTRLVAPGGTLALAIYNRLRGGRFELSSERWRSIKRAYVEGSRVRRRVMLGAYAAWRVVAAPRELAHYDRSRGMAWLHDARDWIGGYPYEFASVDEVERFALERDLEAVRVDPTDGWGNNQYVFRSSKPASDFNRGVV